MSNVVLTGSALSRLRELDSNSVQCIVTSPPYYGLRSYNAGDEEIGQEPTLQEFLSNLVEVFRECRRVLKKDGVCWVNMGDSYCNTNGYGITVGKWHREGRDDAPANSRKLDALHASGIKTKDRMMVPARLAIALQDDGWWLRDEIVWHKPNPMPSSVQDRTTPAHEMIYLFTKSAKYYYDSAAIRQDSITCDMRKPYAPGQVDNRGNGHDRGGGSLRVTASQAFGGPNSGFRKKHCPNNSQPSEKPTDGQYEPIVGANCRSVWTFSTQGYPEAHFATYPEELPKRCILAGSREGDVVLDPFGGSGTTGAVAKQLGRKFVLIELNPEYVGLIEKRLASVTPSLFAEAPL